MVTAVAVFVTAAVFLVLGHILTRRSSYLASEPILGRFKAIPEQTGESGIVDSTFHPEDGEPVVEEWQREIEQDYPREMSS